MAKTTVRCPKCGTAFEIPAKEVLGIVGNLIGENSGLGDVYLKEKEGEPCKPLRDKDGRFVSRSNGISLAGVERDGEDHEVEPLSERVRKQGPVKNHRLFRRWIMSQMFHILLRMKNWNEGFAKIIRARGVRYMWKVLKQEMHDMRAIQRHGDTEEFKRRNRWWSTEAVANIAICFCDDLEAQIMKLKQRKCKGREYVTIPGYGMVFYDEVVDKVIIPFHDRIAAFRKCNCAKTADALCDYAMQFKDSTAWKLGMPTVFIDRFKGAGAYFTLRNMLMFHGCRIPYEVAQKFGNKSYNTDLEVLDSVAEEYKNDGWQMLGFLKDVIKHNGIDVEAKIKSWKKG